MSVYTVLNILLRSDRYLLPGPRPLPPAACKHATPPAACTLTRALLTRCYFLEHHKGNPCKGRERYVGHYVAMVFL